MSERIGGTIYFKVDGVQYKVKGSWTYNIGKPKREGIMGNDGHHGFKEMPQQAYCEGTITNSADMSEEQLKEIKDATAILELANGKIISFNKAYFAGDGNATTEEGEIDARFEAESAEEIR